MRSLSKPIPKANYKGKKKRQKRKKIQGNDKSFKILLLWRLGVLGEEAEKEAETPGCP